MKKIFIALYSIGLVFIMSCGNAAQKTETNTSTNSNTTSSKSGADLYSSKCTACHGADGNMGVAGAKKIPESVLTQQEREQLISNGKGTMPAFKNQLSADEISKVAEYTLTLK